MSDTIEQKCLSKGVKLTEQRRIIAKVYRSKEAYGKSDHPDVDELYNRVSKIDPKISIATVYRTVKLFEKQVYLLNMILKLVRLGMKLMMIIII